MPVLNEDFQVDFEQFQRFAELHRIRETGNYRLAMANWRLAAGNQPEPPRPAPPAPAWSAQWGEPRETTRPILIYDTGQTVCPIDTDPIAPVTPDPAAPRPGAPVTAVLGAGMGRNSPFYWTGVGDNAPDGYVLVVLPGVLEFSKHVTTSIMGTFQYYEKLAPGSR